MQRTSRAILLFAGTVTEDGQTPVIETGFAGPRALSIVATDPETLTSLDVDVQHSPDGVSFFVLDSFTQISGATTEAIVDGPTSSFSKMRLDLDITGTSVDIEVYVEA